MGPPMNVDSPSEESLENLITSDLLAFLAESRTPFSKTESIDWDQWLSTVFLSEASFLAAIKFRVWPILVALTKIKPAHNDDIAAVPFDPMRLLPPAEDRSFPEQCLGMQILLDQCPRYLCRGVDTRWLRGYFDLLSTRFARSWLSLPAPQRPDTRARWTGDDVGASLDYWLAVRFWFSAPLMHSESHELHLASLAYTDEVRRTVEEVTGVTDPHRTVRNELLGNPHAFPDHLKAGPPQGAELTQWTWWITKLADSHYPIISLYGRYPYVNGTLGRQNTPAEEEWLHKTEGFAAPGKEVADTIFDDVQKGRWTPLGAKPKV